MESPIMQSAREVLLNARNQEDGLDHQIVRLPCDVSIELMQTLALNVENEIKQIIPIKDENVAQDGFEFEIIRQLTSLGRKCKRIYIIPHLGFAKNDLKEMLKDDKENGIESKTITMGNISFSTSSLQSRPKWIIDRNAVVDFCDEKSRNSQCIVTNRKEDLYGACAQWDELWKISISDIYLQSNLDLQEPLVLSADLINGASYVLCTQNHVDEESCEWYHGTWQYLRLLDMVSTPTWHHSFYSNQISKALSFCEKPKTLITGTADYSVLAYLINSLTKNNKKCDINVLDLCATPLFACKWYAKKNNIHINTFNQNIFEFSELNENSIDVVVTDAFLTRFARSDAKKILSVWSNVLSLVAAL